MPVPNADDPLRTREQEAARVPVPRLGMPETLPPAPGYQIVGRIERTVKWVQRNPVVTAAVLAVVLSLTLATVCCLKYLDAEQQRRIAEGKALDAEQQRQIAEGKALDAEQQRGIAEGKAIEARQEAEKAKKDRDFLLAAAARAKEESKDKPTVEARLVATKTIFTLDLAGLTAADYKKALTERGFGELPPAPKVEIALELTNTSDKDVQVLIEGHSVILRLEVKGPGAVWVMPGGNIKSELKGPRAVWATWRGPGLPRVPSLLPTAVTLAPGKRHSLPIFSPNRGIYWTEPGDYTFRASLMTALNPAPMGAQPDGFAGDGFGKVTLTSEPIWIEVEKKD
jgi:hypothetical protein